MDRKTSFYLFVFLFVLTLLTFLTRVNAECEMTFEDLDNCALSSTLFIEKNFKIPKTEDELTEICG